MPPLPACLCSPLFKCAMLARIHRVDERPHYCLTIPSSDNVPFNVSYSIAIACRVCVLFRNFATHALASNSLVHASETTTFARICSQYAICTSGMPRGPNAMRKFAETESNPSSFHVGTFASAPATR